MKKFEFETSKGKFAVIDHHSLSDDLRKQYTINHINNFKGLIIDDIMYSEIGPIEGMNEQQADQAMVMSGGPWHGYKDYRNDKNWFNYALLSLLSLCDSSGYYMFDGPIIYVPDKISDTHSNLDSQEIMCKALEVKEKTMYYPILFKIEP